MSTTFKIKEVYYTLQGEGFYSGRPAIFCRFSGCNLWSGREIDRAKAICNFCDTDFVGTNGPLGGDYKAQELARICMDLWPEKSKTHPFVVFTGGEPMLQVTSYLIDVFKKLKLEIAIETNGTMEVHPDIDWVCVSPKAYTEIVVKKANELKLVYPQKDNKPSDFEDFQSDYFYLQPLDNSELEKNTLSCISYIKEHPHWRLSIQSHKYIGID